MNPDKLFDYLDGKLAPADRAHLEEKLISDELLRRQFEVARKIHRSGPDAREVVLPPEDPAAMERAGKLGRRIAVAAVVLVFANVGFGLLFISWKNTKPKGAGTQEAQIRQQLAASLNAAGQNVLPAPSFASAEIQISAPANQWQAVAAQVSSAAEKCSGSSAQGLPEETVLTMLADIPSNREAEFRQILARSGLIAPSSTATTAATPAPGENERTIVQVRIAQAER
jgi:hypothetical protein